ncbi:MAG: glycosyltransferase [Deltaproteobacteria bacterium]|nr:glycosyltransferase [Deltaproteobacteria bacterium]
MRIAQVSPLYESVPPRAYGGTERVVSYLTEELVAQGHDVTLFASGDSLTAARLIAPCKRALRLDPRVSDPLAYHYLLLEEVFERASQFDIIHFHIDYLHFPLSRRQSTPQLSTLHGRLDIPDLMPLYGKFSEMPLVSISNAQRKPFSRANWQGTVYHGLPADLFACRDRPGDYLAFLGRISPEKRPDRAIEIANRAGMKLKMAAKVDPVDRDYMEQAIRPLLGSSRVEFIGEINQQEKKAFLANAYALLCPFDWPEPFGLVMIEAMACGTPVIAFRCGSVPELIQDEVTGFIVNDVDGAVAAIGKLQDFDRLRCREIFEKRFSAARMVEDYLKIYHRLDKASADYDARISFAALHADASKAAIHYDIEK